MAKKSRSYGINDVLNWKFEKESLPEQWVNHLGDIPKRFLMYVDGDPGHGKTEYIMQGSKMFANHAGKVHLNNVEQGKHSQITDSAIRNDFKNSIPPGKWIYSSIHDFEQYCVRIKRPNSGRIQIIDSISFWPLSLKQIQRLIEEYRYKSFVFVGYKSQYNSNKPIIHHCDIKVRVEDFKAYSSSRYGGNQVYDIWPERNAKKNIVQPSLFDNAVSGVSPDIKEEVTKAMEEIAHDALNKVEVSPDPEPREPDMMGRDYREEQEEMYRIQRDIK